MNQKSGKIILIATSIFCIVIISIIIGVSFALHEEILTGTKNRIIVARNLELEIDESKNLDDIIKSSITYPIADFQGKKEEGYQFSLINKGNTPVEYAVTLEENEDNTMPIYALRYQLVESSTDLDIFGNIADTGDDRVLHRAFLPANSTHDYTLRIWLGLQAENDAKGKSYSAKIKIDVGGTIETYFEKNLNGCDPVLTKNLVPVKLNADGTAYGIDLKKEWYNYGNKEWANAVVLVDKTQQYAPGEEIPSDNIQSYFVWIPRYKYQLFNTDTYDTLTTLETRANIINIIFETKNASIPSGIASGDWHSHPAFQAFDSNGFWIGKYESGYNGATSTATAQVNTTDVSKLIIRPNVFSWRSIALGNAFQVAYNYLREDESHLIKNTEWGAVSFLQHSIYGSHESVRVNNNNTYKTGYAAIKEPTCGINTSNASSSCNLMGSTAAQTTLYNTEEGYHASTTGNITGVYDMAGGSHEYTMGYNTKATTVGGNSGLSQIYGDFFTSPLWEKYYDKYESTTLTTYTSRILGDATVEMGPFQNVADPDKTSRPRNSWYADISNSPSTTHPWVLRGFTWSGGQVSGNFASYYANGAASSSTSFRVILTP